MFGSILRIRDEYTCFRIKNYITYSELGIKLIFLKLVFQKLVN